MNGYVPKRRGVIEHLRDGRMSAQMYAAHDVLLLLAERTTGIWWGSAKALASQFGYGDISERQARNILESLESGGYIKRFSTRRSHRNYPMLINRYLVTSGAHSGMIVNAAATTAWRNPVYELCLERGAQQGLEQGPEQGLERTPIREVRSDTREGRINTLSRDYAETQLPSAEILAREKIAARAAPTQKASRFPENFHLSEKLRDYATSHGMPAEAVAGQFEHFQNHHLSKGTKFISWERAWYTWVLRRPDFTRGGSYAERETSQAQRRKRSWEAIDRAVEEFDRKHGDPKRPAKV